MAESTVSIKIDIDARTAGIDRVRSKLTQLAAEAKALDQSFNDVNDRSERLNRSMVGLDKELQSKEKDFNKLDKAVDKNRKSFDKFDKKVKDATDSAGGFRSILKKLVGLSLKGFLISLGLTAASLVAVNVAFKIGSALSKAWGATVSFALKSATAAGAALITVLAGLAAAQKQYLAASQASRYGGGVQGMRASSTALRGLTSDTKLAVFGAEALQGAFAAISQKTKVTGGMTAALRAMGDFVASAADPKKALAAAGQFLGELSSKGKLTADAIKAAAEIGPEFEKAVKQAQAKGLTSSQEFLKALLGGDLSSAVAGQLNTINATLIGTVKRNFELIKTQFADFGQPMLKPFTEAAERLSRSFRVFFMAIMGSVRQFATGPLLGNLESMINRALVWAAKMFNEYLPQVDGMLSGIKKWVRELGDAWDMMVEKLRPLTEGGQILIDTFAPLVKGVFGGFGQGLYEFNDLVKENKDEFLDFGKALAELFGSISRMFGRMKEDFVKLLPVLTKIANLLADVMNLIVDAMNGIAGVGGMFGSALNAALFGMVYVKSGKGGKVGDAIRGRMGGKGGKGASAAGAPLPVGGAGGLGVQAMSANIINITAATVNLAGAMGGFLPSMGDKPAAGAGGDVGWSFWGDQGGPVPPGGGPVPPGGGRWGRFRGRMGAAFRSPYAMMAGSVLLPAAGSMLEDWNPTVGGVELGTNAGAATSIMGSAMMAKSMGFGGAKMLPAAGVAAAGYYTGGVAAKTLHNLAGGKNVGSKTHAAGSVAAGAGAGALTGAAIGSFIPIIGTGVGAVLGGIAGGIAGFVQSGKLKKEAKKSAQEFAGGYGDAIQEALAVGDVTTAQKLMTEMKTQGKIAAESSTHVDSFNKEFNSLSKEIEENAQPAIKQYNKNVEILSKYTGKSVSEIKAMADAIGFDLTKSIDDVGGALTALTGLPAFKTLTELRSFTTMQLGGTLLDVFQKPQLIAQAGAAVDEAGTKVLQSFQELGAISDADLGAYLTSAFEFDMAQGLTGTESLSRLLAGFGTGGFMYQEGNKFAGMEDILKGPIMDLIGAGAEQLASSPDFAAIAQQIAVSTGAGSTESITAALQSSLKGKTPEQRAETLKKYLQFSEMAINGTYGKIITNNRSYGPMAAVEGGETTSTLNYDAFNRLAAETGINLLQTAASYQVEDTVTNGIEDSFELYRSQVIKIGDQVIKSTGDFVARYYAANPPTTIVGRDGLGNPITPGGDTTTSRLMSTLGRHSMYNSMLPGKRMITSSLRDTNLGSLNSDHLTGNAYDLVGQNLVSYANLVNQSGGFAEFHGGLQDRHLHVVPGDGPVGDTMAPLPSMSLAGNQVSTQNSYQIVVNPPAGASPQDIAEAVMQRIYREQRSAKERQ